MIKHLMWAEIKQMMANIQSKPDLTIIEFNDILNIHLLLEFRCSQTHFVLATKGKLITD